MNLSPIFAPEENILNLKAANYNPEPGDLIGFCASHSIHLGFRNIDYRHIDSPSLKKWKMSKLQQLKVTFLNLLILHIELSKGQKDPDA